MIFQLLIWVNFLGSSLGTCKRGPGFGLETCSRAALLLKTFRSPSPPRIAVGEVFINHHCHFSLIKAGYHSPPRQSLCFYCLGQQGLP